MAELGHTTAIFLRGINYQDGTGVEQDMEKAVDYYRQAIDAGYEPDEEDQVRLEEVLGEGYGMSEVTTGETDTEYTD